MRPTFSDWAAAVTKCGAAWTLMKRVRAEFIQDDVPTSSR